MPQDASAPQGFRVLVIVSRPLDLPDLQNLADQWALQSGLRRVQAPAFLKMLRPPAVEGLRSEIMNGYDIVHFDGHGALGLRCKNCGGLNSPEQKECDRCDALLEDGVAKGYFAFEREDGKLDALAAEVLHVAVETGDGHAGWLQFGRPGIRTLPVLGPVHFERPTPGKLVLFPSYMWHGTTPIAGDDPRMTMAFDVVPDAA
jgi:hypothetical protein